MEISRAPHGSTVVLTGSISYIFDHYGRQSAGQSLLLISITLVAMNSGRGGHGQTVSVQDLGLAQVAITCLHHGEIPTCSVLSLIHI